MSAKVLLDVPDGDGFRHSCPCQLLFISCLYYYIPVWMQICS